MNNDEKPSDAEQSEPGTLPTEPLAGAETTPSVLQVMYQQARAMQAMAYTLDRIVAQNQDLLAIVIDEGSEEEGPAAPHGYDMSGNPIKVS